MLRRRPLGRDFAWLWAAFGASTVGTWLALDAFPLIAILVLHSSTAQISFLAATGLLIGALIAVPLGPWVEFRPKRPVLIAMDVIRFVALLSVPAAYALGALTYLQLVGISVVVAAANIVFTAAGGAYLKTLVRPADLLVANGRFEATTWTSIAVGPPLGGLAIGVLGPLTTVVLDAGSYLLSALGIRAIRTAEPAPPARSARRVTADEIVEGWRFILRHRQLRPLFINTSLVNGLIMATAPLLAVLLLRDLRFAPWQYGLAFGVPCIGGLIGSRLASPLVARFGQYRVLVVSGVARACWSIGLAFVPHGQAALIFIMTIELGLITSMGIFNPTFATYRIENTPADRISRTLSAWSISSGVTVATMTLLWGVLAGLTNPRVAIAVAGGLIMATALIRPPRPVGRVVVRP
ncbi:MFS transporter [Nocardia sp. GCM10030253]|uniref:MFS transporter n=1 Tax=Nocardia sp. GCM10030253 TaxID=3273404 RepID=UPI00362E72DE